MSIYLDTIKVLEKYGWYQGAGAGLEGGLCVVVALSSAAVETSCAAFIGTLRVLDDLADRDVIAFNDDPHTTYEDVVLLLKRAHEASEPT